jgi:integrase
METITLREHIDHVIQCIQELQLSENVYNRYKKYCEDIFLYCSENHLDSFGYQDAAGYCGIRCSSLKEYSVKETTKIAYTIATYFKEGDFIWKPVTFTQYPICGAYERLMEVFRLELLKNLSSGTVRGGMVIIRQFLYFLEQSGTTDASCITTANVLDFIRQEAPNHKGSMAKLLRTVRKFVCFLRRENITDIEADRYLTVAGRCRQKALPCFSNEELQSIFAQIDRSTNKGRRDYAVFLTALRTGLRASDISGLKLSDIDWRGKTIRIVQKKTMVALHLPLPADVGNAIADYILHSRHSSDSPYVFLRLRDTPSLVPIEPTAFNYSLREYMKAAGMERTGWDGRSFHALRRTAGTRMVTSGVPVSTVAQILGHTNVESSKRYISLDTQGLRGCCLDLGVMHTRKEGLS